MKSNVSGKLFDIFISYSSDDKKLTIALCHFLEERTLRCWMAPRDIQAGRNYGQAIIEAIQASSIMVVVFTKSANSSVHVRNEVERAFNHQLIIMPFRTQDIIPEQSFEYFLSSTHWLDAIEGKAEDYFEELFRNCASLLEKDAKNLPAGKYALSNKAIAKNKKGYIVFAAVVIMLIAVALFYSKGNIGNTKANNAAKTVVPDPSVSDTSGNRISEGVSKKEPAIPLNTEKQQIEKTSTGTAIRTPAIDLSFFNGATYRQNTTTYSLMFSTLQGDKLQFSGDMCGYNVNGKLNFMRGMSFEVYEGNVTGNISFSDNNTRATGNFIIKESNLSCAIDLKRVNEQ